MKNNNHITYCFVAGSSGGHIIPALTLARDALRSQTATRCILFSTASVLDQSIISRDTAIAHHYKLNISAPPLRRPWRMPLWFIRMLRAFIASIIWLYRAQPSMIISTGGFVSIPVVCAAWILRIPITLYELNVEPGKANKLLAPLATTINIIFDQTRTHLPHYQCTIVPYPLRDNIRSLQPKKHTTDKRTLLILGGSQGSVGLNNFVYDFIHAYSKHFTNYTIIHQTGSQDTRDWKAVYASLNITHTVIEFTHNLETLYAQADWAITRAGAGCLCELEHLNIPSIIIPLETSYTAHQIANAYAMADKHPQQFYVVRDNDSARNSKHIYRECINFVSRATHLVQNPLSAHTNLSPLDEQ